MPLAPPSPILDHVEIDVVLPWRKRALGAIDAEQ
jgi:hypothetical protein